MEKQKHITTAAMGLGLVFLIAGAGIGWALWQDTLVWQHLAEQTLCWWLALGVPTGLVLGRRKVRWYFTRVRQLKRASAKGQMPKVVSLQRWFIAAFIAATTLYGRSFITTLCGGTMTDHFEVFVLTSVVLASVLLYRVHPVASKRAAQNVEYVSLDSLTTTSA